jgi:stage V sporulation protein B
VSDPSSSNETGNASEHAVEQLPGSDAEVQGRRNVIDSAPDSLAAHVTDVSIRANPGETPATAKSAGRGGIAIAFAKIYFIVTGLAQQLALGNILGPGYGALSTVMGIASISYNPLIQTGIQGVSRPVAQSDASERPTVIRRALSVHFVIGIALAALFFLLAPFFGAVTNAPYLTPVFRLFSIVLLAYGLYGPLIGVLNGQRKFLHQAGLDILAATLRTAAMVGAAFWAMKQYQQGVAGAALGFGLSAGLMFLIASAIAGFGRRGKGPLAVSAHFKFIGPLLLGQFVLNLLFQADMQLLGAFARQAATDSGIAVAEADELVGAYRAAQLFGFLPYQLLIAVSFVLFPMLASADQAGDRQAVADYVRVGVRLALIIAGLAVSVSLGLSGQLLTLTFPAQPFAALAGNGMRVLVFGLGAFAIFGIFVTVLNSLGRERAAMALTAASFALIGALCWVFVRGQPFSRELLMRTALAAALGHLVAALCAAVLVRRRTGAVVHPLSFGRVVVALGVSATIGYFLPDLGKLMTVLFSLLVGMVYLGVLTVLGELGRRDLELVAKVVRRR